MIAEFLLFGLMGVNVGFYLVCWYASRYPKCPNCGEVLRPRQSYCLNCHVCLRWS